MLSTNFHPFPELDTQRLVLRRITNADAPAILNMRGNEMVMKFIDRERAHSIADAEAYIAKLDASLDANDGITWGIALKEYPATIIGTIGYWRLIKEHLRAEVGYMLEPIHWKKGIMKEALLKIIATGFNTIKLHSIEAHINPENSASASILLSTGFVKEAHFRDNFFYDNRFRDTAIYSLVNEPAS